MTEPPAQPPRPSVYRTVAAQIVGIMLAFDALIVVVAFLHTQDPPTGAIVSVCCGVATLWMLFRGWAS